MPTMRSLTLLIVIALAMALLGLQLEWPLKLLMMVILLWALYDLTLKADANARDTEELHRLRAAYEQLDQQAKLIIRTDLELHRIQEELDRKLASLFALHELGQQLRVSLHPDEIYGKLDAELITSFGFSKGLIGVSTPSEPLTWRALIGVNESTAEQIRQQLLGSAWLQNLFTDPTPRLLSPSSVSEPAVAKLFELLDTTTLATAGVVPHDGPAGCLILARKGSGTSESRGEEELVAILTTQLAVAVENSMLYEKLWRSSEELERKVRERTQELAQLNSQLLRFDKAKSDFVSAVSHELRTPLAAIKGYASLLRNGQFGPLANAQIERLAKVEKHADLLTQLINNLLDIARIESGRATMEPKPIEVEELITTVLDIMKPQLDAKRIKLTTHVDGVSRLVGDPTQLPRIFVNLLSNAAKYTPEGGSITIDIQRDHEQILTSVRDTGCGISPQELPKLFQEFYRTSNPINEKVRGTGLGLALVKRIIEAHHGKIWVASEPGKGTTFSFILPAEPSKTA